MGNVVAKDEQAKNVILMGLSKSGKTHMLYTYLVGEGGMHTIPSLEKTIGWNFEQVEESALFNVWDMSGATQLHWQNELFLKSIKVDGVIFVVNINRGIEIIHESK